MSRIVYNQKTLLKIKTLSTLWIQKAWFVLAEKMKQKAKEKDVFDLWTYIKSFYSRLIDYRTVRVWNTKWYARIIEYWRQPWTYPNFDALVWWTARKFWLWWKTLLYDQAPTKLKSMVFLVARSIKKKGIKWKTVMQEAYKENRILIMKTFKSVFK